MAVTYNNISKDLEDRVPKLDANQTIQFKLLGTPTVIAEDANGNFNPQPVFPASYNLPITERIYDEAAGKYVELAIIKSIRPASIDGKTAEIPVFGNVEFPGAQNGIITLTGQPKDRAMLIRLALSNFNKDSVNPAKEVPFTGPVFEMIKPEVTAKQKNAERLAKLQALAIIEDATEEEFGMLVQRLGVATTDGVGRKFDNEELKNYMAEIAETNPDRVKKASSDEYGRIVKNIREGVTNKVIEFSDEKNAWLKSDSKEVIVEALAGHNEEEALITFFQENPKADRIFPQLVKANNAANEKRKPKK